MAVENRAPISVVMATYNGGLWIERQLQSILAQLTDRDEVIICDDISDDFTRVFVNRFQDKRIKLYTNPTQLGAWENVKHALSMAENEIIFIADQDDVWEAHKVATVLAAFDDTTELVMHDASIIDGEGVEVYPSYFQERGVRHGALANALHNSYTGCFCAFKKTFLEKAKPFPSMTPYDQWLGIIAEKGRGAKTIPEKLVQWRRHGENVTTPFGAKTLAHLTSKCATLFSTLFRKI